MSTRRRTDREKGDGWAGEDAELLLGQMALHEKDYEGAELYLRQAQAARPRSRSPAAYFLAQALLWQGRLDEAGSYFDEDQLYRRAPESMAMVLWCGISKYRAVSDYLRDPDLREVLSDAEAKHPGLQEDRLALLAEHVRTFARDWHTPGGALLMALWYYLRGDLWCCLRALARVGQPDPSRPPIPRFAVPFWQGMTHLALGHPSSARRLIERSLCADLPPVLLLALRVTEQEQAPFFHTFVRPRLLAHHLLAEGEEGLGT